MASNIPIIEDAGSMKNGVWVPDWKAMTSQAKKLGAKTVKTRSGKVIYFDNNYNPTSVDENPQMKAGGKVASSKTVTCSNCGWSWNKSDSSNKDMYVCHQCGRDNSNKSEGWLDKYDDGGYVPIAQKGLTFLETNSPKLPMGYDIPSNTPSTELSMSIGGENGEPAYLIPSFKGGRKLKDPIAEYKKTGEHLGGPFKTWQEAEKFGEMRHKYVEKGQDIPSPIKTWGDMAMGGSLPGSVGFTYARTAGSAPANGKYTKKTLASAQDGKDVAKNWLKNWYEERKELPQFTEIASKRSNVIDEDIPVVLKPASEMKKMNAIAAYNPRKKYIEATDPSTMADVSTQVDSDLGVSPYVLGHEMIHHLDVNVPQVGKNVPKYPISFRDVNFVSPKQSGLSSNDYDWITSDALSNTRTEANAVLYGLREAEGLKGNKPTTPDQLKGIIEKYNNLKGEDVNPRTKKGLRNSQIKMLIDSFGGDPEKLSEINNRIVKGFSKEFPTAQNGQEMSYYQNGLDFKTKGMKNGGWLDAYDVPQAQEGNVFAKREPLRPASESTSIMRNIPGEGPSTTATTGQRKEDVKLDTEGMARFKAAETKDKQKRVAERKSAISAKDKGNPFTLPSGETKKYEDMDWREKAYVSGKSLESKGRANENDEAWYDEINPISLVTNIAGGLATAPLEARESNSNMPYLSAIATPLVEGAFGFDPLGGAMKFAKSPLAKTLIDIPRAESIKEAIGRAAGIPLKKDIPRMGIKDVKALREVQKLGGLEATGSSVRDQIEHALENNLPDEHFERVFGQSKEDARYALNSQNRSVSEVAEPVDDWDWSTENSPSRSAIPEPVDMTPQEIAMGEPGFDWAREAARRRNLASQPVQATQPSQGMQNLYNALFNENEELAQLEGFGEDYLDIEDLGLSQEDINATLASPESQSLRARFRAREAEQSAQSVPGGVTDPNAGGYLSGSYEPVDNYMSRSDVIQSMIDDGTYDQYNFSDDVVTNSRPATNENLTKRQRRQLESIVREYRPPRSYKEEINKGFRKFMNNAIQDYPYSDKVKQKVPGLFLGKASNSRNSKALKNVYDKVWNSQKGIESGDVFTGSTNTSHSSYLPQLKQVFKYTKGDPQFLGYERMNDLGFLSNYGYSNDDIAGYLNSEIDEQIKRKVIPKNIQRPYVKGKSVVLPQYGVKQRKEGGVVKDDMGYWNPNNRGKVVEIGSPYITMEGVDEPLIGISDEGDKKYMLPGKNYKFKGKKVREYPVAKNGLRQEQKGLQNLDQLTNFTNYNKPQPGGWLNKYN